MGVGAVSEAEQGQTVGPTKTLRESKLLGSAASSGAISSLGMIAGTAFPFPLLVLARLGAGARIVISSESDSEMTIVSLAAFFFAGVADDDLVTRGAILAVLCSDSSRSEERATAQENALSSLAFRSHSPASSLSTIDDGPTRPFD